MTQALLLVMGSISAAMPVIAAIFGCVVTSFFLAVNRLRKEMVVRLQLQSYMCQPASIPQAHNLEYSTHGKDWGSSSSHYMACLHTVA